MSVTASIVELSARIAANTAKINDYLVAKGLPSPSFDIDGPSDFPSLNDSPDLEATRQDVIYDCAELRRLMQGPRDQLRNSLPDELTSQKVIVRFRLAHAFPVGAEITFAALAAATGLGEVHVRKIVRHAITQNIFCEPRPGVVAHSSVSRLLAEDEETHNWTDYMTHELWPAGCHLADALEKYPKSGEATETGYAVANNTDKSMFAFLSEHPERLKRFAIALRFLTKGPGLGPELVAGGYPWGSLPDGSTVVDVGGSHGLVCFELARKFPGLKFVVQDLDEPVIRNADARKPADVADRVSFMAHDFFTPQPVHGAEVYLIRAVLHNWSDRYAIEILRNLVPALKTGAKIVINDSVTPESGATVRWNEARVRGSDLRQLILQNAGDREMAGFAKLFEAADPRFEFKGGSMMPGSTTFWFIVAEWKGT